jgi:hypothetical protein
MRKRETTELGVPAITIAGFQLWIHGWQFAKASDYDDANWLRITAHCGESDASVWASGALLMTTDISRWADQCEALYEGKVNEAALVSFEPELEAQIKRLDGRGQLVLRVEITPDHLRQEHAFEFEIDKSVLPELVRQCRELEVAYPVRGLPRSRGV